MHHIVRRRSGIGRGRSVAAVVVIMARLGLGGRFRSRGFLDVIVCLRLLPGLGLVELLVRGLDVSLLVLNLAGPALLEVVMMEGWTDR